MQFHGRERGLASTRLQVARGCPEYWDEAQRANYFRAHRDARQLVRDPGIFSRHEFNTALFDYLNLSIEQILTSADPIIRSVGMLDRRLGKRRVLAMNVEQDHPLVRELHAFRLQCEQSAVATAAQ